MDPSHPTIDASYLDHKGDLYKVTDIVKHAETHEDMVIYKRFRRKDKFVCSLSMWMSKAIENGAEKVRFVRMRDNVGERIQTAACVSVFRKRSNENPRYPLDEMLGAALHKDNNVWRKASDAVRSDGLLEGVSTAIKSALGARIRLR